MTERPLILVVDDDGPILVLMRSLLLEFGFEPMVASSGEQALLAAQSRTPHLVLLDKNMPGMTGDEVIRRIRGDQQLADVPVVMLTGEPLSNAELVALGANAAILKPFELGALVDVIRSHVGAARPLG